MPLLLFLLSDHPPSCLPDELAVKRIRLYNNENMPRVLTLLSFAAVGLAGCCSPDPEQRVVPTSTVMRVEPQPTTLREFKDAEQLGCFITATGRGAAFGIGDQPVQLDKGEALRVLRVDLRSGEVLVRRLDHHTLARVSPDALEVRATTYGR